MTIIRWAFWGVLTVVLVFSPGLFAQARSGAASRDLNATLAELIRVAPATNQDLAIFQQHSGRFHSVTFWQGNKAHKVQMTTALRRNLEYAVPSLVQDAQASGGSISKTFALYKDLTVVCESLDSMLPKGSREDNKDLAALNNDLSDMSRLKEELAAYIERTAASMDNKNTQFVSLGGRTVKKIIVDDTVPEKPSPRKRSASNQ